MSHHPPPLSADSNRVAASGAGHAFENENGAEYGGSRFGDFGDYFRNKKIKLQNLDAHIRESDGNESRPPIFKGCIIHVNGYTVPNNTEIHRLVVLYGGVYYQYMDGKTSVTHIVASHLTPKKMIEFARYRVVKPEWITQSIKSGKLLPWHDFRLIEQPESQRRLDIIPVASPSIPENDSSSGDHKSALVSPKKEGGEGRGMVPDTNISAEEYNAQLLSDPKIRNSTVLNPDFLKTYYGQSRLHHLSIWKADLKLKIQNRILLATTDKTGRAGKTRITRPDEISRIIFHVDFDCFFASVALRSHPELIDKPVCVGHGGSTNAEVASCNYVARQFGVRNGMWMHRAKELCPDIRCLPYEFDAYEEASAHLYNILLDTGPERIEAVSIDEALLDVTNLCHAEEDPYAKALVIAQDIRDKVLGLTKCNVSIGIGANILQSKVATKKAKPAGQYCVRPNEVIELLHDLKLTDLPGIGYSICGQLKEQLHISKVGEILQIPKSKLQDIVGAKTGEKLYLYAQGQDNRQVGEISMRKSVSAEVNWGVRFENIEQLETFLYSLAGELSSRLLSLNMIGTNFTLKVYKRAANAPLETPKFLGCGECDAFSRSTTLASPTCDAEALGRQALALNDKLKIPVGEIRGLGLQMTKLVSTMASTVDARDGKQSTISFHVKQRSEDKVKSLQAADESGYQTLAPVSENIMPEVPDSIKGGQKDKETGQLASRFPSESVLDPDVLAELPPDIVQEIRDQYSRAKGLSGGQPKVLTLKPSSASAGQSKRNGTRTLPSNLRNKPLDSRNHESSDLQDLEIDADVLNELPQHIRDEIIGSRNMQKPTVSKARDVSRSSSHMPPRTLPTFQGKSATSDLRSILRMWVSSSLADCMGPHEDDVHLLERYLQRVVTEEMNINKAVELVRWMKFVVESALQDENTLDTISDWLELVDKIQYSVSKAAETRQIFGVQFV